MEIKNQVVGTNVTLGIICINGFNDLDSILINQSSIERSQLRYLKHDLFPFQLFCAQAIDNENESQAENAIEMEVLAD